MAIIAILASLLVPGLANAKEQAKATTCINNLRQIGIGLKLYVDDNDSRFPANHVADTNGQMKIAWATLGGYDPQERFIEWFPSAGVRPLNAYIKPSEVYKCPMDQGQQSIICPQRIPNKPSDFSTIGCSYHYNGGELNVLNGGGYRMKPAGSLALQREDWMPQPDRFLVMHEPPARLYTANPISTALLTPEEIAALGPIEYYPRWYQWHESLGRTEIDDPKYARQEFISPILFGDGHVAIHNFSKSLSVDPYFPYEPTKNWIWYKPKEEQLAATGF